MVVVGDVNSTMACTLVCAKLGITVAHVEAGLRSFDRTMPEEINRIVTDALADLLLTPSADGDENLRREGISARQDPLRRQRDDRFAGRQLVEGPGRARSCSDLGLREKAFAYVTLHRPSNVDGAEELRAIIAASCGSPPICRSFSRCIRAPRNDVREFAIDFLRSAGFASSSRSGTTTRSALPRRQR